MDLNLGWKLLTYIGTIISRLIIVGLIITSYKFIGPYRVIFLTRVSIKSPFLNNFILASYTIVGSLLGPFIIK